MRSYGMYLNAFVDSVHAIGHYTTLTLAPRRTEKGHSINNSF